MNEHNIISKDHLSSKDAGAILGYTHDYISRLCRHGKMSGIQKGREWFVTKEELEAFKQRHEIELQEKKKLLSKKFSQIRLEHEAKKRKARELNQNINSNISEKTTQTDSKISNQTIEIEDSPVSINKEKVKFTIPRQLVAAVVLALVLVIPTLFNSPTLVALNSKQVHDSIDFSIIKSISSNIEQGIHDTIYAQSTVVKPVASVFAFAPYLADGYWQFFTEIGKIPKQTYLSLQSIGNGYLTLYVLQGEAIYYSIQNLSVIGNFVLDGYELVGQSFLVGSREVVETYMLIFGIQTYVNLSMDEAQKFTANVSGGFEYVNQAVSENLFNTVSDQIRSGVSIWIKNIKSNMSAMQTTISQISHTMSAYVGSMFEFNLMKKNSNVRVIEL